MTVCVDAPSPGVEGSPRREGLVGPQFYWRGITYDTFDGRAWGNGSFYQDELLPDEPIQDPLPGAVQSLEQQYRLEAATGQVWFAAAEPLLVDQPLVRLLRGPGDLIALQGSAGTYRVRSMVPRVSAAQLRAAPASYPDVVRSRYLSLPEDTPARLRELAFAIAGDAPTHHDAALALQRYLRQFEYDLGVPPPPPGEHAVAYFLYELQRGYCDYYASAFVVLARALGVPARLAVGYATGEYDPGQGCYEVLELHGHSWPEVYSSGYGWIPFEPTPAFSPFERAPGEAAPAEPEVPVPARPRRSPLAVLRARWRRAWQGSAIYFYAAGVVLLITGVLLVAYRRRRRRKLSPLEAVVSCYGGMVRLGERLGAPRRPSHTVHEYADLLSASLQARLPRPPWRESGVSLARQEATTCVHALSQAYVRASYAAAPPTAQERAHAEAAWQSLRRRMRWLWLISVRSA
jgi:transglutaminase-like putative cysteine protease